MKIIPGSRRRHHVVRVGIFLIAVILIAGMAGCIGTPVVEIQDWYDLDDVRNNLGGSYILMNNLDSTTAGYEELASPTANGGKGWQPLGFRGGTASFTGTFDGQGHEIRDLFINRPDQVRIGLFGMIDGDAVVKNLGVVNFNVTGDRPVGGLAGYNWATISNSYSTGSVTGNTEVGGLVGANVVGTLRNCYSIASVSGDEYVGGLVGTSEDAAVYDSHSSGNVTGHSSVGGLIGANIQLSVPDPYSDGSVTGNNSVGILIEFDELGTVSNSYSTADVTGNNNVGGLVGEALGGTITDSYSTGSMTGDNNAGGLVGYDNAGTVSNSFWDIETSGQATSAGGTGKNTTQMQAIATFSDVAWDIVAVGGPSERNPSYIWNIVNNVTYPFLSWQS